MMRCQANCFVLTVLTKQAAIRNISYWGWSCSFQLKAERCLFRNVCSKWLHLSVQDFELSFGAASIRFA